MNSLIDTQIEENKGLEVLRNEVVGIDALSTQALQKNTLNELVHKWEELEGNYILLRWKLARHISDKFPSKKDYGQFIKKLRLDNPFHALCTIDQSTLYRYACAARFCEKFEIDDLNKTGLLPTAIYSLSKKANESVVDSSFVDSLKNNNLSVGEIDKLIFQAHSIPGELIDEPIQSTGQSETEMLTQDSQHLEATENNPQDLLGLTEKYEESAQPISLNSQPLESCIELTNQLTEDQVQRVMNLLESFNLKSVKKEGDKKAYFNMSTIEYGDPVQVTVCFKSDW